MKTDMQLKMDLIEELKWEPSVNAAEIGVEVKEGIVALSGHVGSYEEKWNAERAAQRVAGVGALTVDIEVKLMGWSQRDDVDIARSAEHALQWMSGLPRNVVKILVEKGWVTLSGAVDWEFQRNLASTSVRSLMGVTGVSNQITLKAAASGVSVKKGIEAALKRRAIQDSNSITVAVSGNDVTLSGAVHSWSERELAVQSAWGASGVHTVVDQMHVAY